MAAQLTVASVCCSARAWRCSSAGPRNHHQQRGRGREVAHLVGLISRRTRVRIPPAPPPAGVSERQALSTCKRYAVRFKPMPNSSRAWAARGGPPEGHAILWFLLPGETWWHFTHPPHVHRQVPAPGFVGVGVNADGFRLAFLRRNVPCSRCESQGAGVLASGRKQVRLRKGRRISWICEPCAIEAPEEELRQLVQTLRQDPPTPAPARRARRESRSPTGGPGSHSSARRSAVPRRRSVARSGPRRVAL